MTHGPDSPTIRRAGPALLALLLMSYAWLAPGMQTRTLFGVPVLLVYLFAVWALAIVLVALMRAEP